MGLKGTIAGLIILAAGMFGLMRFSETLVEQQSGKPPSIVSGFLEPFVQAKSMFNLFLIFLVIVIILLIIYNFAHGKKKEE